MSHNIEEGYMCDFRVKLNKNMIWPDPFNQPDNCIRFLFQVNYFLRKTNLGSSTDQIVDTSGDIYVLDMDQPLVKEYLEMFMALKFAKWGLPYRVRKTIYSDIANRVSLTKAENVGCTVLPIDVAIDIYTVQKGGEDIDVTMSRLIKSRTFGFVTAAELPEYHVVVNDSEDVDETMGVRLLGDLLGKVKVGVGDSVKECVICLDTPCVGAEICFLPCSHMYHFRCILRWLERSPLCPFCRERIAPTYPP